MVDDWRSGFNQSILPFYIVQLTSFSSDWREFREIQKSIADDMVNSGLAVTIDGGDLNDIHPPKKKIVGDRLGYMALAKVYGQDYPISSPEYRRHIVEDNKIRVYFDHVKTGLTQTGKEEYPLYFEIAAGFFGIILGPTIVAVTISLMKLFQKDEK